MFPSWLCYYLPLPIISLYGHAVLEGVHRLSKGFAFWKIRTFVLRSLPVVYDVFVLAFQTVLDVMTITCYLSYNLAGWFQGEGTDRALFLFSAHFRQARPATVVWLALVGLLIC